MYAVISHTFEIVNPEPENPKSLKIFADWKHYVWLFDNKDEAMSFAITLLDTPLLKANNEYFAHAVESLETNNYWQTGRESVAVGEVIDSPELYGVKSDDTKNDIH